MPTTATERDDATAELLARADRCDLLAADHTEDNPLWSAYLSLKARHLRMLARDLETEPEGDE